MADSAAPYSDIAEGQGSQVTKANNRIDGASPAATYAYDASSTSFPVWGYKGGHPTLSDGSLATISAGTVTLSASATNYIVALKSSGAVSVSSVTTNWNSDDYWRLYSVACGASGFTSWVDYRQPGLMTGMRAGYVKPVTKTADFILGANENEIIVNGTAAVTVAMPTASLWVGRKIRMKTIAAFAVNSASSNVCPLNSATAGTAILAATAGKWAELVSDGTNWIAMAGN